MDDSNIRGNSTSLSWLDSESSGLVLGQVRSGTNKHFCSIEYTDEEGDKVIKHAFLTIEEQKAVIEECARNHLSAKVYDLDPSAVISKDDPLVSI